jgi:leucine dehydrogenase
MMKIQEFEDKETGIRAILGIHSEGNGTTFGGIRLLPHGHDEEAMRDAHRLSEAMTHKLAMIGEPFGGSKMVLLDSPSAKRGEVLHKIGEIVESLEGTFITAIDFGFQPEDALKIREMTRFILGFKGPGSVGASGITTALGAFEGMPVILQEGLGCPIIKGKKFMIQGLGSVGRKLAELLLDEGAILKVSDTDDQKLTAFRGIKNVSVIDPDDALTVNTEVLCPSGPACVINPETIARLRCKIITGVGNCVLEDEDRDDRLLRKTRVLFAPDFVLNAGGVIQGIEEHKGNGLQDAIDRLPVIPKNLRAVFSKANNMGVGTMKAAKRIAGDRRQRIARMR